jgi:hypothetical protein
MPSWVREPSSEQAYVLESMAFRELQMDLTDSPEGYWCTQKTPS